MATAIASRYARALADVVSRTGDYRRAVDELAAFADVYRESGELREVLKTPVVSVAEKSRILDAILTRLETSPMLANFFRLLLANYRLSLLDQIRDAFGKIVIDRMGIARVQISSAAALSTAEQKALVASFEAVTRRTVEAVFDVVPNLLGGVTAQIESTVYDGSVRGHLNRIRERLTAR